MEHLITKNNNMNQIIDLREITDEQLDRLLVKFAKENETEILNILLKEKGLRLEDPNHN